MPSTKKKIITIVGVRPQFVKLAAVSPLFEEAFNHRVIHTGQHYDYEMSGLFFDDFHLPPPTYQLDVSNHRETEINLITYTMNEIERIFLFEKPDGVVVFGDANPSLAGAFVASKLGIPVFHIEAGIRGKNRVMKEEVNRKVIDELASLNFSPTQEGLVNLKEEGKGDKSIVTGDVMYDLFLRHQKTVSAVQPKKVNQSVLVTFHRAENTDNSFRLKKIVSQLQTLSEHHYELICPLHPRTKKKLEETNLYEQFVSMPGMTCTAPVSSFQLYELLEQANIVITDSGGTHKEAYYSQTPCFFLRNETEYPELVKTGWLHLVDIEKESLLTLLTNREKPTNYPFLFGKGKAVEQITAHIQAFYRQ